MNTQISNVHCYYTGGGIYVYSARYGDAWLYGTLDQYIECFSVRGEVLFNDESSCEFFGWMDELKAFTLSGNEYDYYLAADQIKYPTWQDILDSLRTADLLASGAADMEETLKYWNPDLSKRTNED